MHCPKQPYTVVNIMLYPEEQVLTQQQYYPVNYRMPVYCEMILVEEIKDGKTNKYAQEQVDARVQQVQVNIYQCFLPAIEFVMFKIAQYYLQGNKYGIDGYG
jgi:hypothetical protein